MKLRNQVIIFLSILIVGYSFFFLSKPIFGEEGKYFYTEQNKIISFGSDRTIEIIKWTYSKNEKKMEIFLNINNNGYDTNNEYTFRSQNRKNITNCKLVAHEGAFYVLETENIPKSFKEIYIAIGIQGTEYEQKIYNNINDIALVNTIPLKSLNEYKVDVINFGIENVKLQISDNEKAIEELNNNINVLNEKIVDLKDSKTYQTTSEMLKTDEQIKGNYAVIESKRKEISTLEAEIKELRQKIKKQELQITELLNKPKS